MKKKERVKRMMDVYCRNLKDPLEIVSLKEDLLVPMANLPEAVERIINQNGTHRRFIYKHLTKEKLMKIEKKCTEDLILSMAGLNPLFIAGRIDMELRKTISEEESSIFQKLSPWTRTRLSKAIGDDLWQNIFDALRDDSETRKAGSFLLRDFLMERKNGKMSKSFESAYAKKDS